MTRRVLLTPVPAFAAAVPSLAALGPIDGVFSSSKCRNELQISESWRSIATSGGKLC